MQVKVTKSQNNNTSPVRFELRYDVTFTPEERALFDQYGLGPLKDFLETRAQLQSLLAGSVSFFSTDIRVINEMQRGFATACERLREYLEDARNFSGTEEFPFNLQSPDEGA